MPRLTPTGPHNRVGSSDRLGFGVPAYAHPLLAPQEWAELARPGTPLHWVALNVSRGPGSRPDPLYTQAVARLREAAVPVLGVLDTRHGARPFAQLLADAHRYLDWYRVDGFYLDRAPTDPARLPDCRRTTTTLRQLLGADEGCAGHLVLGHGSHPCPGYAEIADQLVTFSGPWATYRWSEAPQWTADHPPQRFCHLVHGMPGPHLDNAMRVARWQGAATVFFTDRTNAGQVAGHAAGQVAGHAADHAAWEGLPGYWDEASRMLGRQSLPGM